MRFSASAAEKNPAWRASSERTEGLCEVGNQFDEKTGRPFRSFRHILLQAVHDDVVDEHMSLPTEPGKIGRDIDRLSKRVDRRCWASRIGKGYDLVFRALLTAQSKSDHNVPWRQ